VLGWHEKKWSMCQRSSEDQFKSVAVYIFLHIHIIIMIYTVVVVEYIWV
jgi:hypothetical protein